MVTTWLPRIERKSPTETDIYCLPHAGGGSAFFHRWAKEFPSDVRLVPVKLPGRESRFREPQYQSLDDLVQDLAPILEHEATGPFALLGQSMGALIAFELARQFRRNGRIRPSQLIVAASCAPHIPPKRPLLHEMTDEGFLDSLDTRFEGIDPDVKSNDELMKVMLPTMRADIRLVETYAPTDEAPLDIPILAMGGAHDSAVSLADLDAWRQHTAAQFTIRKFSGGHFFIKENPGSVMRTIVQRLRQFP